jgi:hypothetical protein
MGVLPIAMPTGPFNPVISAAFTVAPAVVYSPIEPAFLRAAHAAQEPLWKANV